VTAAATGSERLVTREFVLVVAAAALGFVTIGMLLPAVPLYADDVLGAGGVGIGVAAGAASATTLLAQPLAGRLGDRRGRRMPPRRPPACWPRTRSPRSSRCGCSAASARHSSSSERRRS
jgi:MFS family permease